MSGHGLDARIRIRVEPEPSPVIMAAIVAAVRARRSRRAAVPDPPTGQPGRWGMAGRREAMIGRDGGTADPSDRW